MTLSGTLPSALHAKQMYNYHCTKQLTFENDVKDKVSGESLC